MTDQEIDNVLRAADRGWNVWGWGQAIVWLHNRDPRITLSQIEVRLRALSKTTFFVARSLSKAPTGMSSVQLNGEPGKFWLWICLNGPDEMMRELAAENKSIDQNQLDLVDTGLLVQSK